MNQSSKILAKRDLLHMPAGFLIGLDKLSLSHFIYQPCLQALRMRRRCTFHFLFLITNDALTN